MHPPLEREKHNQLFAYVEKLDPKEGTFYADLTGRFPVRSIDGMITVFILYDWITNAILAEPIENAKSETLVQVFK